jgi:hypothetical protein
VKEPNHPWIAQTAKTRRKHHERGGGRTVYCLLFVIPGFAPDGNRKPPQIYETWRSGAVILITVL